MKQALGLNYTKIRIPIAVCPIDHDGDASESKQAEGPSYHLPGFQTWLTPTVEFLPLNFIYPDLRVVNDAMFFCVFDLKTYIKYAYKNCKSTSCL